MYGVRTENGVFGRRRVFTCFYFHLHSSPPQHHRNHHHIIILFCLDQGFPLMSIFVRSMAYLQGTSPKLRPRWEEGICI